MLSSIAAGAVMMSFVSLLIPPFITRVTGSPLRAGLVLAVIGLAALSGPWIGRFADKHRAHKQIYILSLVGFVVAFVILALDSAASYYGPLAGLIIGLSSAAQATIGASFIVGAGYSKQDTAKKLTIYSLLFPAGQVLGAAVIGIGLLLGATEIELFWLAAIFLGIFTLITWPTLNDVSKHLHNNLPAKTQQVSSRKNRPKIVFSVFGLFLLAATLGAIANNGLISQVANILPNVYGFSAAQTSGVVGLAGLLSVGAIIFAGKLMAHSGSFKTYKYGAIIKWVGMSGMAIVGMIGGAHLFLATIMVLIPYQGLQITKLASPDVATKLAPVATAEANGYYFATSALGTFLGSLGAGALAQFVSYNSINQMSALLSGLAVLILVFFLTTKIKRPV